MNLCFTWDSTTHTHIKILNSCHTTGLEFCEQGAGSYFICFLVRIFNLICPFRTHSPFLVIYWFKIVYLICLLPQFFFKFSFSIFQRSGYEVYLSEATYKDPVVSTDITYTQHIFCSLDYMLIWYVFIMLIGNICLTS